MSESEQKPKLPEEAQLIVDVVKQKTDSIQNLKNAGDNSERASSTMDVVKNWMPGFGDLAGLVDNWTSGKDAKKDPGIVTKGLKWGYDLIHPENTNMGDAIQRGINAAGGGAIPAPAPAPDALPEVATLQGVSMPPEGITPPPADVAPQLNLDEGPFIQPF